MKIDARTTSEMTETTTDSENETHAGTTIADTFALSSGFCASAWMATNTAASPDRSKPSPRKLHIIFASRCTIESRIVFAFVPCFANKYLRWGRAGERGTTKAALLPGVQWRPKWGVQRCQKHKCGDHACNGTENDELVARLHDL